MRSLEESEPQRQRVDSGARAGGRGWGMGLGGEESECVMGTEFQLGKMPKLHVNYSVLLNCN